MMPHRMTDVTQIRLGTSVPPGRRMQPGRVTPPPDALETVALLTLATALLVAWRGYAYGDSHHSVQVPLQRAAADPTLYARDLLIQSAAGYVTFFFRALAAVERVVGHAEALYFVLYVAGHLLVLGAIYALARLLFRSRGLAALACFMYAVRPPHLGGEASYFIVLTHGHVATGLLLWSVWLHLRGHPRAALLLVGLSANLHVLYALHVAALLGLDLALRRRELGARRTAEALGVFVLAAAPTLAWLAATAKAVPAARLVEWLAIMRERSPQHTFPFAVRPEVYGAYALFLGLAVTLGRLPPRRAARRTLLCWFAGVALLCAAGLVFSEFVPVPMLIRAQLLRSTKWLTLLLLPLLARGFGSAWLGGGLARAAVVLACGGTLLDQPGLLAAALLLVLIEGARQGMGLGRIAVGAGALVLGAASGAAKLPPSLALGLAAEQVRGLLQSPLALGFAALLILARAALSVPRWRRVLPAAAAVAALALLPAVERLARVQREADPWYQVQRWSREHTPRDALFLTPPYKQGFRVFSERALVGEWKDGTQQFFSAGFGFEWHRRMRDLKAPGNGYDGLRAPRLVDLGRRYGAEYAVTAAECELNLPRLFQNEEWSVYSLTAVP